MSEPWIDKIVQDIKEKAHKPAEQAAREEHQKKVRREQGPIFWRDFIDFLQKFVEEIQAGLHGDITEGIFMFESRDNTIVNFAKSDFPSITFKASPDFEKGRIEISLTKGNLRWPPSGGGQSSPIPCRFEVRSDDTLIMQLNGHAYDEAEQAAKFIIEKAFTIEHAQQ